MSKKYRLLRIMAVVLVSSIVLPLSGCITVNRLKKEAQQKGVVIENLNREVKNLNVEVTALQRERSRLQQTQNQLQQKLQREIETKQIILEKQDKGLVVTVLAEVLFDPGKAEIKSQFKKSLGKIIEVLKENVPDKQIIIEGHTDSDPIRHSRSKWKSNWELSSARANSIIHYFIKPGKFDAKRLSSAGYGSQRPVTSNRTKQGKARNRRVEIVIIPQDLVKEKAGGK